MHRSALAPSGGRRTPAVHGRAGVDQLSGDSRRAALVVAIGAIALDSALLGIIAPLLPEVERRTGASEAELGLALAAYALPILVVSLPLGRLADRVGRRRVLLIGLILTAVGSGLIAVSESLTPLIAGRVIQGTGAAASWIAALALVSDFAPAGRKGEAIGYALAANSIGAIGGPALGGIGGDAVSYAFPFIVVIGVALALVVAGWFALPRGAPADAGGEEIKFRELLRTVTSGGRLPAALAVIAGAAALALVEVVLPLDADQRLGLSATTIGALFAGTILVDAIAAPVAGGAGDRVGRTPIAFAGLVAVALSCILLATLDGIGGLIVGLAVFGIGSSAVFAAAVPWLDEAFPTLDKGFGFGFLNVIYGIGYSIGPLAGGFALQASGPALAYGAAAVAIAVPALLMLRPGSTRPGPGAQPRPAG